MTVAENALRHVTSRDITLVTRDRYIVSAAQWLADETSPPAALVTTLQARFDLTAKQACDACALASKMRMLRSAFA